MRGLLGSASIQLGLASALFALGCASGDGLNTGGGGQGSVTVAQGSTVEASVGVGQGTTQQQASSSNVASASSSQGSGGGDPCAGGCAPNTYDIDNQPVTGQCGCEYQCEKTSDEDPIDASFTDDNCDGGDGLVEQCVYVWATMGDDTAAGTRTAPVATIQRALEIATANAVPAVCLSGDVYQTTTITVPSGVSIYGGFDPNDADFAFRRKAGIVSRVEAEGTVFLAQNINAETHIEGLTIFARMPLMAGMSTYGVRLEGGTADLYVRYNNIEAANGAPGSNGADGDAHAQFQAPSGDPGDPGCEGSGCGSGGVTLACQESGGNGGNGGYNNGNGGGGSPGSGGAAGGSPGGSARACFSQSNNGGPGTPGANGSSQGAAGSGGASIGVITSGLYFPAGGGNGQAGASGRGGGGGGGGGGGSCDVCVFGICSCECNQDTAGGGGSGGCGGLGGNPGARGGGGGGSFGIFAATGRLQIDGNSIVTRNGGNGGRGGNGAGGQLGGSGSAGGTSNDDSGGGGTGGKGGDGRAGGPGGGGGGGPSACLARGATVVYVWPGGNCTSGAAGLAGQGGTNPDGGLGGQGQPGMAGANLQLN